MRSFGGIVLSLLCCTCAYAQQQLPYYPQFDKVERTASLPQFESSIPEVPSSYQVPKGLNRYTNPAAQGHVPYFVPPQSFAPTQNMQPYSRVAQGGNVTPLQANPSWNQFGQGANSAEPKNSFQPSQDIPSVPEEIFLAPSGPISSPSDRHFETVPQSVDMLQAPTQHAPQQQAPAQQQAEPQASSPPVAEEPEKKRRWLPFPSKTQVESTETVEVTEAPSIKERPVAAVQHHVGSFYSSATDTSCGRCDDLTRIPKMFGGNLQAGTIAFTGAFTGAITTPTVGAGAFSIADNGSPIPTDRIFVTYQRFYNGLTTSLLNGAVLEETEFDFDFYTAGLEKTFFNQRMSIDVRVPFVDTELPEDFLINGTAVRVENGIVTNVNSTLKGVLWENDFLLFSAGVGMRFVPGANSTTVTVNQDVITYEQSGVDFAPFLGMAGAFYWDTFMQGIVQYNMPTDDDQLTTTSAGVNFNSAIRRQQSLSASISAGKWLVNRPGNFFSGLSLISEANYSMAVGNDQAITLAPGAGITTTQIFLPRYDTLSLSGGMSLELWSRLSARAAASVPVLPGANRFYDTEVQGSINWRF